MKVQFNVHLRRFKARILSISLFSRAPGAYLSINFDHIAFQTEVARRDFSPRWDYTNDFVYETDITSSEDFRQKFITIEGIATDLTGFKLGSISIDLFSLMSGNVYQDTFLLDSKFHPVCQLCFEVELEFICPTAFLLENVEFQIESASLDNRRSLAGCMYLDMKYSGSPLLSQASRVCVEQYPFWPRIDPCPFEATHKELMLEHIEISPRYNDIYQGKVTVLGACRFPIRKYLNLSKDDRSFDFEEDVTMSGRKVGTLHGTLQFINIPPFIFTTPPPLPKKVESLLGVPRYNCFPVINADTYVGYVPERSSSTTSIEMSLPRTSSISKVIYPELTPQKEGWLSKQGNFVKSWKQRWFRLTTSGFLFYWDSINALDKTKSKGTIYLGNYMIELMDVTSKLDRPFCFKLRGLKNKRLFLMSADDEDDLRQWVMALQRYTLNIAIPV